MKQNVCCIFAAATGPAGANFTRKAKGSAFWKKAEPLKASRTQNQFSLAALMLGALPTMRS